MESILGMDICSRIRLSIIIPVYNAEPYLKKCLNAIATLDCEDIEVLLIDDGSSDLSGSICDGYSNKDVRFHVYHQKNKGVSSARNLGLEKAKGEWITFVDADDLPTECLLEYCPNQESDLVCFNWKYTTGESEKERLYENQYSGERKKIFLEKHLVDFIFRTPWAKLFRRSIIVHNNIRFDERFRLGEDNLFVLDYLNYCEDISTKNELGYIYLRPSQSKYSLQISSSIFFLTEFMHKYKMLNVDCQPLILLLEYYYYMKLYDRSIKTRVQWERYKVIREIQNNCWKNYSVVEKLKIILRRIYIYIRYGDFGI